MLRLELVNASKRQKRPREIPFSWADTWIWTKRALFYQKCFQIHTSHKLFNGHFCAEPEPTKKNRRPAQGIVLTQVQRDLLKFGKQGKAVSFLNDSGQTTYGSVHVLDPIREKVVVAMAEDVLEVDICKFVAGGEYCLQSNRLQETLPEQARWQFSLFWCHVLIESIYRSLRLPVLSRYHHVSIF